MIAGEPPSLRHRRLTKEIKFSLPYIKEPKMPWKNNPIKARGSIRTALPIVITIAWFALLIAIFLYKLYK